MQSLSYLLDKPVPFRSAPELFCLDFYKYFDLDRLAAVAAPAKISTLGSPEPSVETTQPSSGGETDD
jgi:hypothetical protein